MTSIDATLARLLALHPKRIDLSLERIERLLGALGNPERRMPPVIHVSGTNGKGSTIAFMRAMLETAGRSVHVYTSPHLVRFNERYRLGAPGGGALVADRELANTLAECERINAGEPITVFEIMTAVGFLLFARNPADLLLLEVGMGGRLDATNVVERPLASVITSISLDHAEYLGETIEAVAAEKAGIMKKGVPVIIAPQRSAALTAIEACASKAGAPLRIAGEHWMASEERGRIVYQDDDGLLDLPAPKLFGRHQFDNAGTAIATLRTLRDLHLPVSAYEGGVVSAEWPARMQRLSQGHLVALAPPGSEIWLDGAHNPEGGRAVAAALADLEERVSRPLVIIAGMLTTKDCGGFLGNFAGLARRLIAIPVPQQEKGFPAEAIADSANQIGIPAQPRETVEAAFEAIRELDLDPAPRVLITGSLYLAGAVLAANGTPPQ
ncbi:MAG: bifunctional folylpolyglutamate synthase/dihydrofolate synthase [Rhizobiales bacterium]|nr:bifunctional folylpolyglutamate synthase/dihydrofolate synthase [Hyphomicrobiales bacterium]